MENKRIKIIGLVIIILVVTVFGGLAIISSQGIDRMGQAYSNIDKENIKVIVYYNNKEYRFTTSVQGYLKTFVLLQKLASENQDFTFKTKNFEFGSAISDLLGTRLTSNEYWQMFLNNKAINTDIKDVSINGGDLVEFKVSVF